VARFEVTRRIRLFLEEACSSMFVYCQRVLHFAEGVAYKRIHAARAVRRFPELLDAVRRGELHLTGLSLLAPQITTENSSELIAAAKHKSADEIRRLLADRQPRPHVAASMQRVATPIVPESVALPVAQEGPTPNVPDAVAAGGFAEGFGEAGTRSIAQASSAPLAPATESPLHRAHSEPLGGERYCVRFTADRELHEQIQELRALMRHQVSDGDLGKILARAVGALLGQVRKRRFAESDAPRPAKPSDGRTSRQIPAAVRRAVARRDGGRCTYESAKGVRCGAREFLEFHHHDPWARSRVHSVSGISLRCRAHNQHAARRDFGERHMDRFRGRRANRVDAGHDGSKGAHRGGRPQLDLDQVRGERPREGKVREADGGASELKEAPLERKASARSS